MGRNPLKRMPQVLIVGDEGTGKTTLAIGESLKELEPTQGYNRFEKCLHDSETGKIVSIWDVSGNEILKPLWSAYYKNIFFSGVIYVIDSNSINYEKSIKDIHFLVNEEELRDAAFLILFNMKGTKKEVTGRKGSELSLLLKGDEIHTSTKINYFEFNFKGYDQTAKNAFTWLEENMN
ncbi:hypothetical protein SteCoe_10251 [Stentor coeruleus]|uniref:Uncharacterized protein n=1 Tax=Stentor coeruleus TaxID=5963 RepID=A0A1R2CG62_9CILI|nr:hypothetical protein SteCoe_10251 [Stentor coeruleus]